MKTIIAITLAMLMAIQSVPAQTQTNAPPPADKGDKNQMILCFLVISACALGCYIIIYAASKSCGDLSCKNKRLILQISHYDGNWLSVATNDIAGLCTNRIEVFRHLMRDDTACYRVIVTDIPQTNNIVR